MSYLIGIDIGTTSAKALLIDELGNVRSIVAPDYDFSTPKPLWAESEPDDWWQATIQAIKYLLTEHNINPTEIAGIGLTGQMHGLVLLNKQGKVLRPCIMWNDQRSASQCDSITKRIGSAKVLELTGNPVLAGFTAPKIMWVKENEPNIYSEVAKVLLPKDYIRYRLSGEFYTDVSDASGMSLLDVSKRKWSEEMLSSCEIPREWMPEVTESPVASTRVNTEAAKLTGLLEGTPIIAGGGDQAAGAIGCGIVQDGVISATLGTSGVIFAHSDKYLVEPEGRLHSFCHAVPGKWHLMGVMLSAAGSFQWFRNTLGNEERTLEKETGVDAYKILTEKASKVSAGSEGLLFLPYLSGERMPYPDPDAKGAFIGLTLRHNKSHMTRAVLEGVTYGLRDGFELMRNLGIKPNQVRASGGGTKSKLWLQLLADNFDSQIATVNATEGAAYGAALLAGVGTGVYNSVEDACRKTIKVTAKYQPGSDKKAYEDFYPRYRGLYPALKDEFSSLTQTVEKHL